MRRLVFIAVFLSSCGGDNVSIEERPTQTSTPAPSPTPPAPTPPTSTTPKPPVFATPGRVLSIGAPCVKRPDATVMCWGGGDRFSESSLGPTPRSIPLVANVTHLSRTSARTKDGTIYEWTLNDPPVVKVVAGYSGALDVTAALNPLGVSYLVGVPEGRVLRGGGERFGSLGVQVNRTNVDPPVEWPALAGSKQLSVADVSGCAVGQDDIVKCWGNNSSGQLGHQPFTQNDVICLNEIGGSNPCNTEPLPVDGNLKAKRVEAGGYNTCAITLDDHVSCWGGFESPPPTLIAGLESVIDITGGQTYATTKGGKVYRWAPDRIAHEVPGLSDIVEVSTFEETAFARSSSNVVYAWGRNYGGILGHAPGTNGDTRVSSYWYNSTPSVVPLPTP